MELTVTVQEISLEPGDPKRVRVWEQMVLKYQLRQDGNGCWNVLRKEKRVRPKAGVDPCVLNPAHPLGMAGVGLGKGQGLGKFSMRDQGSAMRSTGENFHTGIKDVMGEIKKADSGVRING